MRLCSSALQKGNFNYVSNIKIPFLDNFILSVEYLVLALRLPITASVLENLRFDIRTSRMIFFLDQGLY